MSDVLAGAVQSSIPGVYQKRGVVWTPEITNFVTALRSELPASVPLVVTSGLRTAEKQASALKAKRDLGDDLSALYVRGNGPAIVKAIYAVPNDVGQMAKVLEGFMARGIYMSQHMTGTAVDFRLRGLSSSQVERIVAAAKGLGGNVVVEQAPPHIHVGARGAESKVKAALARAGTGVKRNAGPFLLALAALGLWRWARTRKMNRTKGSQRRRRR